MYLCVLEQLSECQLILLFCLEFQFYILYHFYPCVYIHIYLLVHLSVYLLIFLFPFWPSPLLWLHLCSSVCTSLLFLVHRPVCLELESGCDFFTLLKKRNLPLSCIWSSRGVSELEVTELSCLEFSSIILNISEIVPFGLRRELLIKKSKSFVVVCFSYVTPNTTVFYFLPMTEGYLLSK